MLLISGVPQDKINGLIAGVWQNIANDKSEDKFTLKHKETEFDVKKFIRYISYGTDDGDYHSAVKQFVKSEEDLIETSKIIYLHDAINGQVPSVGDKITWGELESYLNSNNCYVKRMVQEEVEKQSTKFRDGMIRDGMCACYLIANNKVSRIVSPYTVAAHLVNYWYAQHKYENTRVVGQLVRYKSIINPISQNSILGKTLDEYFEYIFGKDKGLAFELLDRIYTLDFDKILTFENSCRLIKAAKQRIKDLNLEKNGTLAYCKNFIDCMIRDGNLMGADLRKKNNIYLMTFITNAHVGGLNIKNTIAMVMAYDYLSRHYKTEWNPKDNVDFKSDELYGYSVMSALVEAKYYECMQAYQVCAYWAYFDTAFTEVFKKKSAEAMSECEKLKEKLERYKNTLNENKKTIKQLKREARENKPNTPHGGESKNGEATKELKVENDRLRAEVSRLNNEISKRVDTINKQVRENNKLTKDLSKTREELDLAQNINTELTEKYEREKKLTSELNMHRNFNAIPMECFVNAIMPYRIIVIGGDKVFSKLRDYGLYNITMEGIGCAGLPSSAFRDKDLIVFMTDYISHKDCDGPKNFSKAHGTPILNYNGHNAEKLIYDIFQFMNTPK